MARILTAGIVGLLSFGLAAGGSIYLQKSKLAEEQAAAEKPEDKAPESASDSTETPQQETPLEDLPIAVRATPASPEEIVRFGMTFQKREEALKAREEQLRQERIRLKLVSEDVRAEQRELEGLEQQIRGKLASAEDVLNQIGQKQQHMTEEQEAAKKELEKFQKQQQEVSNVEAENIKKMSAWFQAMEPEKAGEYLRELVNDGKMSTAVRILANFEEREASKILAAMNDPALVIQLAEQFKGLKGPEKKLR